LDRRVAVQQPGVQIWLFRLGTGSE
jgi:hypothetical protein